MELQATIDPENHPPTMLGNDYSPVTQEAGDTPGKSSMFDLRASQDISWNSVNFTVQNKSKYILRDCWGSVESGNVCAILGPSGSGKSSLLNVIGGRQSSGPSIDVSGKFYVNGKSIDPMKFRKNIAYVMQDDALMATATPREALQFSAALRLPKQSFSDINDRVAQTLSALGIAECADTVIGNALIKGISGGQRKRTSVGIELITNPSLLLLDEPTSGLDSYTAFQLIHLLQKIAASNATVLCTIHQPSSEVFHLFDQAIFLASGRILYNGPVKSIVSHFSAKGYTCPQNYNPSDYVMYLSQTEPLERLEKAGIIKGYENTDGSPNTSSDDKEASALENGNPASPEKPRSDAENDVIGHSRADYLTQLMWLMLREGRNTFRNVPALIGRFGVTIVLSIIVGLIFYKAGGEDDSVEDNFSAHAGLMTFAMIDGMFMQAQPALLEFPNERPMFLREYSTGTYSAAVYCLGKVCLEVPLALVQCCIQMAILYNMGHLQGDFIVLMMCSFGVGMVSASVSILVGSVVTDPKQALEIMPIILVPQILFAGFFIRTSQIPIFLRWAQYACGLKYAINIFAINEFASYRDSCDGMAAENCMGYKDNNGINPEDWYIYVIILGSLFVGLRTVAMFMLSKRAKRFY
eukprot:CAMPEP_0185032880 /NCGR_PEP_ID=MMETSP1103-20130426/21378_1 /TAXON_ID=36769 /ORGANISM="Paraphysomonas bandaiensis, Strain Caron Lab Isolate" /LENGTH=637 /DNA_ID=CAMNT_0027568947 /DNA_START=61 /DNA_END=1974 /DNA_ORIENTATION=-